MSRSGSLLPIPAGSELARELESLTADWPDAFVHLRAPRSAWLTAAESLLAATWPTASSADRKLTARHLAPFPLALPGTV